MIKCPVCKELISPSSIAYKASCGFVSEDGSFHEQESVLIHRECHYDYTYNPFSELEELLKNG
tara:strand:+ start:1955 stop:2143 length:189 start_codon:yes stop_codon:yes gene_type:complete